MLDWFKVAWSFVGNLHWTLKSLFVAVVIVVLFLAARAGILGEPTQELAQRLVPITIPNVDPPEARFPIAFIAIRDPSGHQEILKKGDPCHAGELLAFRALPTSDAWIVSLGMDSTGAIYPISDENFSSQLFGGGGEHDLGTIKLDSTGQREVFLLVYSTRPFVMNNERREVIQSFYRVEDDRGAARVQEVPDFGDGFFVTSLWCSRE